MTPDLILLAGGLGTRLASVWKGPKCLAPVAGRPFLFYVLDRFERAGFSRACLALAVGSTEVRCAANTWARGKSMRLQFSAALNDQPEGEIAAVRHAVLALGEPKAVLIANADTYLVKLPCSFNFDASALAYKDSNTQEHTGLVFVPDFALDYVLLRAGPRLKLLSRIRTRSTLDLPFHDIGTPEGLASAEAFLREHGALT